MAKGLNFRTIAEGEGWRRSAAEFPLLGMKVGVSVVTLLGKDGEKHDHLIYNGTECSFEVDEERKHLVAIVILDIAIAPPDDVMTSYNIKVVGPAKDLAKFQEEFAREQGYTVVAA